jgi:hypothetical protein
MKKLLLSVCLLSALAPHTTQTLSLSGALGSVKDALINPTTQKIALVAALGWYFCIWRDRESLDIDQDWSWSHIVTRFGEEGYCQEVLAGNRELKNKTELSVVDPVSNRIETIHGEMVTVPAYGVLGVLDAMVLSKLYKFGKFVKSLAAAHKFTNDPALYLGL